MDTAEQSKFDALASAISQKTIDNILVGEIKALQKAARTEGKTGIEIRLGGWGRKVESHQPPFIASACPCDYGLTDIVSWKNDGSCIFPIAASEAAAIVELLSGLYLFELTQVCLDIQTRNGLIK